MQIIIREISDSIEMQHNIIDAETVINLPIIPGGSGGGSGVDGRGIVSESFNSETGILTLTFSDATTYSTTDLRGPMGANGTSATVAGFSTDGAAIAHATANPNDLVYSTEA